MGLTVRQHCSTRSPRSAPVLCIPGCYPLLPHLRSHLVQVYHLRHMGRQRPGHTEPATPKPQAPLRQPHTDPLCRGLGKPPLLSLPALGAAPLAPGSLACARWDRSRRTAKKHRHCAHLTLTPRAPHTSTPRAASNQHFHPAPRNLLQQRAEAARWV